MHKRAAEADFKASVKRVRAEMGASMGRMGGSSTSLRGSAGACSSIDCLPDDVLVSIMASLSARATSPSDVVNASMTCKRMHALATHDAVVAAASLRSLSVPPRAWGPAAHAHLGRAAALGNMEASYLLGMLEFYCLGNRREGMHLLVTAANAGHAAALHSIALIHFNGSGSVSGKGSGSGGGGTGVAATSSRNLTVGVFLCASAAQQGHVEALRELGHCLQDGYGIHKNVVEGRRLLLEANLREFTQQTNREAPRAGLANQKQASTELLQHLQRMEKKTEEELAGGGEKERGGADKEAPTAGEGAEGRGGAVARASALALGATPGARAVPPMTPRSVAAAAGQVSTPQRPPSLAVPVPPHALAAVVSTVAASARFTAQDVLEPANPQRPAVAQAGVPPGRSQLTLSAFLHAISHCLGPLMSDFGCALPRPPPHPANRFLLDWFAQEGRLGKDLKLCGNAGCGRPETRPHEFRCCAVCSGPSYCSRACQALDWKVGHVVSCQQERALRAQHAPANGPAQQPAGAPAGRHLPHAHPPHRHAEP